MSPLPLSSLVVRGALTKHTQLALRAHQILHIQGAHPTSHFQKFQDMVGLHHSDLSILCSRVLAGHISSIHKTLHPSKTAYTTRIAHALGLPRLHVDTPISCLVTSHGWGRFAFQHHSNITGSDPIWMNGGNHEQSVRHFWYLDLWWQPQSLGYSHPAPLADHHCNETGPGEHWLCSGE